MIHAQLVVVGKAPGGAAMTLVCRYFSEPPAWANSTYAVRFCRVVSIFSRLTHLATKVERSNANQTGVGSTVGRPTLTVVEVCREAIVDIAELCGAQSARVCVGVAVHAGGWRAVRNPAGAIIRVFRGTNEVWTRSKIAAFVDGGPTVEAGGVRAVLPLARARLYIRMRPISDDTEITVSQAPVPFRVADSPRECVTRSGVITARAIFVVGSCTIHVSARVSHAARA